MIKIRAEINAIETETIEKNQWKKELLEKISKIDKPLVRLTKKRRHKLPTTGMKQRISLQTLKTPKGLKREHWLSLHTQIWCLLITNLTSGWH